jgi:hypothetical protein
MKKYRMLCLCMVAAVFVSCTLFLDRPEFAELGSSLDAAVDTAEVVPAQDEELVSTGNKGEDPDVSPNVRRGCQCTGVREIAESPLRPELRSKMATGWTGAEYLLWGGTGRLPDFRYGFFADGSAFDPIAGTWRRLPEPPLAARASAVSISIGNTWVIWGGRGDAVGNYSDGALYDARQDRWEKLPLAPTHFTERSNAVGFGANGEAWIFGGMDTTLPFAEARMRGAVFDLRNKKWRALPDAPINGREPAAVRVGNTIRFLGGRNCRSRFDNADCKDGADFDLVQGIWGLAYTVPRQLTSETLAATCEGGRIGYFVDSLRLPGPLGLIVRDQASDETLSAPQAEAFPAKALLQYAFCLQDELYIFGFLDQILVGAVYQPVLRSWSKVTLDLNANRIYARYDANLQVGGDEAMLFGGEDVDAPIRFIFQPAPFPPSMQPRPLR